MEDEVNPPSRAAEPRPAAILTDHLSKRYGRVQALTDLSLRVEQGEIFGFLGPNGSGKSTTIRTLLGYLQPTSGTASILGLDARRDHLRIMVETGYLPSSAAFDETVTGIRALDDLAALGGYEAKRRDEIAERLSLPASMLRRRVRDYSKGTRQKLAIVQALQHDPRLAILDEPSEGLDPLVQHAFYGLLEDLRDEGKTIFLSSHILSEVERICSRVAVIRAGRLVALEDIRELLAKRRRHVQLRVRGDAPALDSVAGVSQVEHHADMVTCRLAGDAGPFVKALAECDVEDLLIEPAHLEDVFLEFYGEALDGDTTIPTDTKADS